jgi:hypothetical protein
LGDRVWGLATVVVVIAAGVLWGVGAAALIALMVAAFVYTDEVLIDRVGLHRPGWRALAYAVPLAAAGAVAWAIDGWDGTGLILIAVITTLIREALRSRHSTGYGTDAS